MKVVSLRKKIHEGVSEHLPLLHSERPKFQRCSSMPLHLNPIALRKVKILYNVGLSECNRVSILTLLYSERPKLYTILAFLSAKGLKCNFGLSECNRGKVQKQTTASCSASTNTFSSVSGATDMGHWQKPLNRNSC